MADETRLLRQRLNATESRLIEDIRFKYKKLDALDYLAGYQILLESYKIYDAGKDGKSDEPTPAQLKRTKAHYRDVFDAAVLDPRLYRKKEDAEKHKGVFIDHLFTEWTLAQGLYDAIIAFTYEKKKSSLSLFLEKCWSKCTAWLKPMACSPQT